MLIERVLEIIEAVYGEEYMLTIDAPNGPCAIEALYCKKLEDIGKVEIIFDTLSDLYYWAENYKEN